jgi:hypothetical protein
VFVAKLNSGNGAESWHTFMGCASDDASAGRVVTDAKGNLFVSGHSPATWGTPVHDYAGGSEAFASKLDANGNRLWNTFLGGGSNDYAGGIAVDRAGNAYVAGHSQGTWGSPLNPYSGSNDVFVARLSPDGKRRWNSFLGGLGGDIHPGVTVDLVGYLYACGSSDAGWGMPLNGYNSGGDGFACKLPYPTLKAKQPSFSPVHNLQE